MDKFDISATRNGIMIYCKSVLARRNGLYDLRQLECDVSRMPHGHIYTLPVVWKLSSKTRYSHQAERHLSCVYRCTLVAQERSLCVWCWLWPSSHRDRPCRKWQSGTFCWSNIHEVRKWSKGYKGMWEKRAFSLTRNRVIKKMAITAITPESFCESYKKLSMMSTTSVMSLTWKTHV